MLRGMSPTSLRRFNGWAALAWLVLVVPTVLWWRESILWVALMSAWANVVTHYGAWMSSRAEVAAVAGSVNRDAL